MSEPIPESIPTSADPRSKRPLKRARLPDTPAAAQSSALTALFAKPELDPLRGALSSSSSSSAGHHIKEIMNNVQGSSAGAGSGEFHVYKASRRREYERLRAMDEEVKGEEDREVWEREREERLRLDEEITRKKRDKRMKKGKKGGAGAGAGEVKKGGMKARAEGGSAGAGGENENGDGNGEAKAVEEVGLIIHDDD